MYLNMPFGSYYPPDNSKFIDPLYVPYLNKNAPLVKGDKTCHAPINTWPKTSNCKEPSFYPDHLRVGWNMDFQRIHPQDPCPAGFVDKGENNGMCTRVHQTGHESNFYTDEGFKVKYQYDNGYTVNPKDTKSINYLKSLDPHPELEQRSVNPYTGQYVAYFEPPSNVTTNTYGRAPVRHSYLGKP